MTETLRQRVLSGLHLGLLKPGDRLPSVREIAAEFHVNARVAAAAYRLLAAEGIVEFRVRSGIYVAASRATDEAQLPRQSDWLADVMIQGLRRDIPGPDLPDHLRRCFSTLRLRAAVLENNSDQLWAIGDELARDYGMDTSSIDLDTLDTSRTSGKLPAELANAQLLVTTAYHALEVRRLADHLHVPVIVVAMRTDLFAEEQRLMREKAVYLIVDDPRTAAKLQKVFSTAPGAANVKTLVNGRDDLSIIPETAHVYLTRLTRARLTGHPLVRRSLEEARMFSTESARDLATFVIRANLDALMIAAVGVHSGTVDTPPTVVAGTPRTRSHVDSSRPGPVLIRR